jgi:DNA polymerase III delta subunit
VATWRADSLTSRRVRAIDCSVMSTPAATPLPPEVARLLAAARQGQPAPVYLFVGDAGDTRAAAHAMLEVLVPPPRRSLNLETYDGRTTPAATVLDSLRTPGFFGGTKVIWVRDSPIFLSGEKRGDLTEHMLEAWRDGRERDAIDKLLTLVALAGWSDEQFRAARWSATPKTRLREVFGEDLAAEQVAVLDAVQAAGVARGLAVAEYRDDGASYLAALERPWPPDAVLILTAPTVDARKRLLKRVREIGAVVELAHARERSGILGREAVEELIARVAGLRGKRLEPAAHELVLRRAGSDAAVVTSELEKLCLYVGERETVTEDEVREVFRDMAESWIFDFTAALSMRQVGRALPLLRGLLAQGDPPLRLLGMIARELRLLLLARECLDGELRAEWRAGLPFPAFQSRVLPLVGEGTKKAFGNAHPFVLFKRFQEAARLSSPALRAALVEAADLDQRFKTGRGEPSLLLEMFVLDWCGGGPAGDAHTRRA